MKSNLIMGMAFVFVSSIAIANSTHTCQGHDNCTTGGSGSVTPTVPVTVSGTNTNTSNSNSSSLSNSLSNSSSTNSNVNTNLARGGRGGAGGTGGNSVSNATGGAGGSSLATTGPSTATVGNTSSTVGNTTSGSTVGNTTSNSVSQGGTVGSSGNNVGSGGGANVNIQTPKPAASAVAGAPVFVNGSDQCMVATAVGGSGVAFGLNIGVVQHDTVCERIKLARELKNMGLPSAALALLMQDKRVADAIHTVATDVTFDQGAK